MAVWLLLCAFLYRYGSNVQTGCRGQTDEAEGSTLAEQGQNIYWEASAQSYLVA